MPASRRTISGPCGANASNLPTVVRPMKDSLALPPPALEIARLAVLPNGRHVTRNRSPSSNLPRVVGAPSAEVVAAVPLEPATGVLRPDPAVAPPRRQRLGGVDAEAVEPRLVAGGVQSCPREPAGRKLLPAVSHVLPAEHAELKHLPWRQLRPELRREVASCGLGPVVDIPSLHPIVDHDSSLHRGHIRPLFDSLYEAGVR